MKVKRPHWFALSILLACGGAQVTTRTPEGERIDASEAGASAYESTPTAHPADGADAQELLRNAGLQGDGRLAKIAHWAGAFADAEPLPREVLNFYAAHLGLLQTPHFLIQYGSSAVALAAELDRFLARRAYTHFGVSVTDHDGQPLLVVALDARQVQIESFSREPSPGSLELRGTLAADFSLPVLALTSPSGSIERTPLGNGPEFVARVPADAAGLYQLELLATGPRGIAVVMNVPVYVGEQAPTSVVRRAAGAGESGSAVAVAEALLTLLNETRQARGLPAVERYAPLDAVSLAHSQDMRDADFVGHRSPTSGDTSERVAAASIRSGLVLENIGRGYGASEIHRALMESPGHRANLLNDQVTHVGLGVVADDETDDAFIATQMFIRVNEAIDTGAAARQIFDAINRARRARGVQPAEWEPNLAEAATGGAARFFAEPDTDPQGIVDGASRSLRRFAIAYRRIGGLMTVVGDPREAERLEPTFDGDIGYIGIGVAQGSRPDTPPSSIGVVILLGWPR